MDGWRPPFQDVADKFVVNIMQLMDGLDVRQFNILVNVKCDGSILLWVKVEGYADSAFLRVAY